jgi:hypothetical protein
MPVPEKPSPSSPATNTGPGGQPSAVHPALAARIRQLAREAEHRHAIAEFHARRAADQQARVNALLHELIAVLASLLSEPRHTHKQPDRDHAAGT